MGVVQIRKQIQANVGPVTSAAIDLTGVAPIPGELVMIFVAPVTGSNVPNISFPAGWTLIKRQDDQSAGGNFPVMIYAKTYAVSDGLTITVTQATGNIYIGWQVSAIRTPTLGKKLSFNTVTGSAEGADLDAEYAACAGTTLDDLEIATGSYRGVSGASPSWPALAGWNVGSIGGTGGSFTIFNMLYRQAVSTSPAGFTHTHANNGEHTLLHFTITEVDDANYYTTGQGLTVLNPDIQSRKCHTTAGKFDNVAIHATPTKNFIGAKKGVILSGPQPGIPSRVGAGVSALARSWKTTLKDKFGGGVKLQ